MNNNVIPLRALGASGVQVPALGVGTNRWGTSPKGLDGLAPVFSAALDTGCNLFDTAELYLGSETVIGECLRRDPRPAFIVTKFAPYPGRWFSNQSLKKALEGSLARLGQPGIDLYLIHSPIFLRGIDFLMDMLAGVVQAGLVRAVGVSNFSARQMYAAARRLEKHGVPLAANEVHYSLFHCQPERDGVLEACRKLNVALIAYFPLASGRLSRGNPTLDRALAEIAGARQTTTAQVALNWLFGRDEHIITIPGTTSAAHLRENAAAAGWALSQEEIAALDRAGG